MKPFGHAALAHWPLDPDIVYLNHGTVGVTPRRVLAVQQALRDEMERQPSRFLLRELTAIGVGPHDLPAPRLRLAAAAVARRFSVPPESLAFVDNATSGANAVLRSLTFGPGDEILVTDLTYGGVARTAAYVARTSGADLKVLELPFPVRDPGEMLAALEGALTPRTRIAVLDHITSETALVLPLAEMAALCRRRGVPVLADGAHAPGALPLDLPALGVDWYTGNLHKWGWSPRSSAILWAAPGRERGLHPPVISWGLDQGMSMEFDLLGTRDATAHLAAPAAFDLMEEVGVDDVRAYNHALVCEGARWLARRWDVEWRTPESMIACMATLPLPARAGADVAAARDLRDRVLREDRIEIQLHAARGRMWVRLSAQVYNEMADVERLGDAIAARV